MAKASIEAARELDQQGWNVIPAPHKAKTPALESWTRWQKERTTDQLAGWFTRGQRNYFIVCGAVSRLAVLDIENVETLEFWRGRLGDVVDRTTAVRTGRDGGEGIHLYFRLDEGEELRCRSQHRDGLDWDLRAEGGGVLAPPSVHPSGRVYAWLPGRGPEKLEDLAPGLRSGKAFGGGPARSMLARLLANPATEGGRNDWLCRVAGHYAKNHHHLRDLYELEVRRAAEMLRPPLSDAEVDKVLESVWRSEQAKEAKNEISAETGWLAGTGENLLCQVKRGDELALEEWADFDIAARGVFEDDGARRVYDVAVSRKRQRDQRDALLPAETLGDSRKLRLWLAELGVVPIPPAGMWPKAGGVSERLQRYLEHQKPPGFRVVPSLGWLDGDGFVCHEGVITAKGLEPHKGRRPEPQLRNWAPYRYGGTGSADERKAAAEILREVLTFHHEDVCSVFGAWWAACLLKPQLQRASSQFPFMALEAPSESGKTTGFFSIMLALNGNRQGQTASTAAALRDSMTANSSGIVWIDDMSDTGHLLDLLRQVTAEGSVAKKGEDRHRQEAVKLVAPVVLSGEGLQLHYQKALLDRSVQIDVTSPVGRMSQRKDRGAASRKQWEDILEFRQRVPDPTDHAGTLVAMALERADAALAEVRLLVPETGGRFGDKIAVVRAGARLLASMVDDPVHIERVDQWAASQINLGSENVLTTKLLPAALSRQNWPDRPSKADGRWPATPAFLDGDEIWFSPRLLAEWWAELRHGRIEARTETAEALQQQAQALGLGGGAYTGEYNDRKRWNLSGDPNTKVVYWQLPGDLSQLVLDRSRGGHVDRVQGTVQAPSGVHPDQYRLELWASTRPDDEPGEL